MYICEGLFDLPDKENPIYSHHEVDYYAWVPPNKEVDNHRLSLRKNLVTGNFEVYRRFYNRRVTIAPSLTIVTQDDTGQEETVFEGTFEEALKFADSEYSKFHGKKEPDKPCQHEGRHKDFLCRRKEVME